MSISMKWSLVSHESFDPNSEKINGFYKGDNFINDIAFGASLFVFCDLNTFSILICNKFLAEPCKMFLNV